MFAQISFIRKLMHLIPVLPVYGIIFTVFYSFSRFYLLDEQGFTLLKLFNVPVFYFCATMVIICHTYAMSTHPGTIPPNYSNPKAVGDQHLFCKKCNSQRPERAHHCKICQQCILKMDHHCPWVANCVGFYNQKYFYLFLIYATVGDFVAFLCMGMKAFSIDLNIRTKENVDSVWKMLGLVWDPLMLTLGILLSLAMTLAIGFLCYAQTMMILENRTTIEQLVYTEASTSPYWSADKWHNFRIVMGSNVYHWFLPIFKPNQYNGGVSWESLRELEKNAEQSYLELGEHDGVGDANRLDLHLSEWNKGLLWKENLLTNNCEIFNK